jgi:PAS domain S-box-containing protein
MVVLGPQMYQESVGSRDGLHNTLEPILKEIAHSLPCDKAVLLKLNKDKQVLENAVGVNAPINLIEALFSASGNPLPPFDSSLVNNRVVQINNAAYDPLIPSHTGALYSSLGLRSFTVIPLESVASILLVSASQPIPESALNRIIPYISRISSALHEDQTRHNWGAFGAPQAAQQDWPFWQMLNIVPDPVIFSDPHHNILLYNSHAQRLLKPGQNDSPGRRHAVEMNNFLLSAFLSGFALDQGASFKRDLALVDPEDGSELLFEVISRPVVMQSERDYSLVTVLNNVTDLRSVNDALQKVLQRLDQTGAQAQEDRDHLNQILESVPDSIIITNPDHDIVLLNPPARRLLQGYGNETQDASGYLANQTRLTSFLVQFDLETSDVKQGELQLLNVETGATVTMSIAASKVRRGFGQPIAIVSIMHDLSQIRELERRRVEQQLFESEKLAALGRLAASVAHEVNNPLESIKNSIYIASSNLPADHPDKMFLDIANSETLRVSRIVRQLLGFYNPQTEKTLLDVNNVLKDSLALLDGEFIKRNIEVRTSFGKDLPKIPAISDQMKQVFLNLMLNASDAMENGGELKVLTRLSGKEDLDFSTGAYVLAEVRDNGKGIPDENLPFIFEPFFSTKPEGRGTGLGLWVCQDIIRRHGGQIKVRSRVGKGSDFIIALPIGGAHDRPGPPAGGR